MYDLVSGYRFMEPGSVYDCVRKRDHNNCGQQTLFFFCSFDSVMSFCLFLFLLPLVYDSNQNS